MVQSHTFLAKIIHWTFIPLYAYGIFKQVDDIAALEDQALLIFETTFAAVFLLIVILRLTYMRRFKTFQGAIHTPHRIHAFIAKSVHRGMYAALILLPLSGLIIAALYSQDIKTGPLQDVTLEVHGFAATLSYVMIATHVSAALYSRVKGEGVWSSMVPILKENGPNTHPVVQKIAAVEQLVYDKIDEFLPERKGDL
ncbi:MAG: cytochrome b/b6 domain-containing protein [Candidatus Thermoplasmatota archaeon]|nr:cytochrome b/b6 domain-containing protein [Candidatus Thermoplasmatota archaeon]